jgi:hypothetical protein
MAVQTGDIIARRVDHRYEIRQRRARGEITVDDRSFTYGKAVDRARALAASHHSDAWIEESTGLLRSLGREATPTS